MSTITMYYNIFVVRKNKIKTFQIAWKIPTLIE